MERGLGGGRVLTIDDEESFPKNFQESFLHHTENKNDLGLYLAPKLISLHQVYGSSHLQLCVTYRNTIISTPEMNNQSSFPIDSTSEEADQKIVRHALHCINENYPVVIIHSIDYDVLILLISYVAQQMDIDAFRTSLIFKMVSSSNTWYDCRLTSAKLCPFSLHTQVATPSLVFIAKENAPYGIIG